MKLLNILNSITGTPETLEEQAKRLEELAEKYEHDAKLRKRIADAEKRIKATQPSGLFGSSSGVKSNIARSGLVKVIIAITVVVVIVMVVVTKAC